MKPIGEAAMPATRLQDAIDALKNALGDFKRPVEEAIQTLGRIRKLGPSIRSEQLLIEMTVNLRDGAALLRGELKRGMPGAAIAASLLSTECNLQELIEREKRG